MYPNPVLFGYDLYGILTATGILCAFVVFRVYLDKVMPTKVFNFYLLVSVFAILLGYLCASLFQSLFNFIATGEFLLFNAGITFYGGLFGGIVSFIALTFLVGKLFFKDNEHLKYFVNVVYVAPCSVLIAHGFGRIGCLFAGCCHGGVTYGFGLTMYVAELGGFYKCVPIQLYEALFLFVLFGITTAMFFKKFHFEMETYLISYGIWRFVIEYFRADDRGALILNVITPSQGFAIFFIISGLCILLYKYYCNKNKKQLEQIN